MLRINRNAIMFSTLTLATALNASAALAANGEKTITLQEDVAQVELIKLSLPAGDVEITGASGKSITAVVTAVCQQAQQANCVQLLKELEWSKKTGSVTEIGLSPSSITRYDNVTIKVKFSIPKDKKLDVNLSAGELKLNETSACLTADVNAGDIRINLHQNQLASAELNAKVGDVKITTEKGEVMEGERSLLVGAHLDWNKGTGTCHTKANVLAGEIQLTIKN